MRLVTPGIIMWGVIMLISMYACKDLNRRLWDEYSHWGLAVKDMFYYNTYATHIESTVWLPRYPPFATLLEWFFVYVNGIFSEGIMYVAYVALAYALREHKADLFLPGISQPVSNEKLQDMIHCLFEMWKNGK